VSRPSKRTHHTSSLTDPYVDPGSQVLRNIPGLVNQRDLDEYEAFTTTIRINQLDDREVTIAGNYDLAHLCALHRHIFQDVYQWAGKLRTVNISKDGSDFALVQFIESAADGIFTALHGDNLLRGLDRACLHVSKLILVVNVRKSGTISDMKTIGRVRQELEGIPKGEPFSTSRFIAFGTRAAVDQALSRLVHQGVIHRVRRGVFVQPRVSRIAGVVPPELEAVIEAIAEATGETVAVNGAEAARQIGLSTQAPLSFVFRTNGKSRVLLLDRRQVQLRHASNRWLTLAGTPAGTALSALRYLGKGGVNREVLEHVRSVIGLNEFVRLRNETGAMPAWLSDELFRFEHQNEGESVGV
jgi:hypothetical protein